MQFLFIHCQTNEQNQLINILKVLKMNLNKLVTFLYMYRMTGLRRYSNSLRMFIFSSY